MSTDLGLIERAMARRQPPAPVLAAPPPLPKRPSLFTILWRLHKNSIAAWSDDCFREDMIVSRFMFRRSLIASNPAAVKHVLLDNAENYVKTRIARAVLKPLGQGLLISEGATWRRQRRIMAPAFHPRRVESFAPAMIAAAEELRARWQALPAGSRVDVASEMAGLTLEIIVRTMFSSDIGAETAEVRAAMTDYQLTGGRPSIPDLLGLPWLRLRRRRVEDTTVAIDRTIYRLIAERREQGGPTDDLLGLLLAARDEETGEGMSDSQLRDELATIITAGHETTANALTWAWYLLALHPAVEETLHAELAALGGHAPSHADVPRLVYTRMVLEEAMRLYPPAHTMSREALADDEVLGIAIPKGSVIIISPWIIHRHETLWERPGVFDPERFAPGKAESRPRYAYIPFGGGPRICIGAHFALTEAILILATLAQHFSPRLQPRQKVEPLGLITLSPKGGLPMRLERR